MTDTTERALTLEQFKHAARLAAAGRQDELVKYVHAIACPRCQTPGDSLGARYRAIRREQRRAQREQAENDGTRLAPKSRVAALIAETFEVHPGTAAEWLRDGEIVVPVAEVRPNGQQLYHLPTVRAEVDRIAHSIDGGNTGAT